MNGNPAVHVNDPNVTMPDPIEAPWSNDVINGALSIEADATNDIANVLVDVQDNTVGNTVAGANIMTEYGYAAGTTAKITDPSGAMVIDDLMQKISTKGQVAAQMLATQNKIVQLISKLLQM